MGQLDTMAKKAAAVLKNDWTQLVSALPNIWGHHLSKIFGSSTTSFANGHRDPSLGSPNSNDSSSGTSGGSTTRMGGQNAGVRAISKRITYPEDAEFECVQPFGTELLESEQWQQS